jgi:2-polyprenyl-6-methoxyphenol hydroxylase-like FAD-dependent oxidoreductase
MNDRIEVDVAVVGGGPAGCAAAISLAQSGRRVALLERTVYGGARVGETLPPSVQPLLRELGVWERFLADGHAPSPGLVVQWGGGEPYETDHIFDPYGCGWNLDRLRFDRSLYEAASELEGVSAFSGVSRIVCERRPDGPGGAWALTFASRAEHIHEGRGHQQFLSARFVVGATGRAAPPFLPPRAERLVVDNLIGVVGLLPPRQPPPHACEEENDPRIWIESVQDGWWYSTPLPGGSLAAVYLTDADLVRDQGGALAAWRRAFAQAPRLASRHQTAAVTRQTALPLSDLRVIAANSYCRRSLVGQDYLLVGDAACAWDPLSGQGVVRALGEGRMAARAIDGYMSRRDRGELAAYEERILKNFLTYLRERCEMYRRENRWPSSPFWGRRCDASIP